MCQIAACSASVPPTSGITISVACAVATHSPGSSLPKFSQSSTGSSSKLLSAANFSGLLAPKITAAKSPESNSEGKPISIPGPDNSSCPGISMMQASMSRCSLRGSPSWRELTAIGTVRKPVGRTELAPQTSTYAPPLADHCTLFDFSALAGLGQTTSVFAAVSNRAMVTTSSPLGHSTTTLTSRSALVSAMTFSAVFAAESDSTLLAVATANWTPEHLGAHAKPRYPCRMKSSST